MKRFLMVAAGMGLAAILIGLCLPATVRAQDCNAEIDLSLSGNGSRNNPLVIPATRTVTVKLGTGTITEGTENKLTVNRLHVGLGCKAPAVIGCADDGKAASFVGKITNVGNSCKDAQGSTVGFSANVKAGEAAPNDLIVTPSRPVVLGANVRPSSSNACVIAFDLRFEGFPVDAGAAPGTATKPVIRQPVGFNLDDATCDNDRSSTSTHTALTFIVRPTSTASATGKTPTL